MVGQVIRVGTVTSTSDIIRNLWRKRSAGKGLEPYKSVLADHQTEGRGRLDRPWTTPPKKALLMSTVVPVTAKVLPWVSLLSGLTVQRTILDYVKPKGAWQVRLKWPNDVLINGKKVAGILCEYLGSEGQDHFVSVGTGLNLTQTTDELPTAEATSLALEGRFVADRQDLAKALRAHLTKVLVPTDDVKRLQQLQEEYRRHCVTLGMNVTTTLNGTQVTGTATVINTDGHLVIEDSAGKTHVIQAGHVTQHHGPLLATKKNPKRSSQRDTKTPTFPA